jgi:23S rRNA (adenine2503-C2)-methyltransferase
LRTTLMPINRRYPLAELIIALRRYPLPPRRRITIEYTLIKGVNDSVRDARGLARVLRGIPVKVNLIPMNPIEKSDFGMPERESVDGFQDVLREAGYSVFVRRQRGDEIDAACGQLALRGAEPKVRRLPTLTPRGASHHG